MISPLARRVAVGYQRTPGSSKFACPGPIMFGSVDQLSVAGLNARAVENPAMAAKSSSPKSSDPPGSSQGGGPSDTRRVPPTTTKRPSSAKVWPEQLMVSATCHWPYWTPGKWFTSGGSLGDTVTASGRSSSRQTQKGEGVMAKAGSKKNNPPSGSRLTWMGLSRVPSEVFHSMDLVR